ncbi:cytochrome P450 [Linderina pennispora]|uniref:Cytochrome P450 n=1 Tax=Linderina pennispora TaxID=61395 RepID=A0A1Y1WE67_9FUNG|nr:cytochrome P450 [Linderina pennispora]ORX71819.1 cytochrome P450 [Linderina pennispora]
MFFTQYWINKPDIVMGLGWSSFLAIAAVLVVLCRVIYALFVSPLRHIPGPFLARLTSKRAGLIGSLGLMTKYSRTRDKANTATSTSDIRAVYGSHKFRKTDFYRGVDMLGIEHMFSTRNPDLADTRRRQFGPYLNTGYLARVEPILAAHGPESLKLKWDKLYGERQGGDKLQQGFPVRHIRYADFPLLNTYPFSMLMRPWERGYDGVTKYAIESAFIDAEDPQSKTRMTERQVQAECLNMLLAGSEAAANTLAWTVHLLMLHPEHYRRAVGEPACSKSMRLHPVSGGLWPRRAPKEGVRLQGYFVPGGTEIFINVTGAHHNPGVWENPLKYDPSRFLDNEEARRNVFTFGAGVRACPGRHLAVLEMMSILANMLKDYDLAVPEDYVRRGPRVLDENGNPKLMEDVQFLVSIPVDPKRDCRLVLTKCTA